MRKEVLLAIVIGVGLGLVLTFGIWTANRALKEKGEEATKISPTPMAEGASVEAGEFDLNIISPEEGDLFDKDSLLVSGKTGAGAHVVVLGEKEELPVVADEVGGWEMTVKLVAGDNNIRVVAFDPESGRSVERMVTVVYSTKFDGE